MIHDPHPSRAGVESHADGDAAREFELGPRRRDVLASLDGGEEQATGERFVVVIGYLSKALARET